MSTHANTVVTRFAPSPTGYLHVGGARTALFNWLLARKTQGKFLLRIEDTDLARSTEDAVVQLLDDLRWLGLQWDNETLVYQSKRLDIYNKLIDGLIAQGKAYEAWESNEELEALRAVATKSKRPFIYRRRQYSEDDIKRFKDEGRKPVVRFAMPVKEYRFHDMTLGKEIVQTAYEVQDFIIRKGDGMPTYHFGVVVDDADMGITHVLRGFEHLLNTINHIALQDALGYPRPLYAHLSVMLNPETGQKLSKRDRDRKIRDKANAWMRSTKKTVQDLADATGLGVQRLTDWLPPKAGNTADDNPLQLSLTEQTLIMPALNMVEKDLPEIMIHDFRRNGYLPEVLNNFLALQGWSPGGDLEQMSIEQMTELFSLDRVGSSNPKFNREKLLKFNTEACEKLQGTPRLLAAFRDYLSVNPASPLNGCTDAQLQDMLKMNHGFHVLREADEKSRFLITPDDALTYDPAAVEKVLIKNDRQGATALKQIAEILKTLPDWTSHAIETAVKSFCEQTQLGLGKVAQPLRVAVSGTAVSPPIFDCLVYLGKDSTLKRIERCLSQLPG